MDNFYITLPCQKALEFEAANRPERYITHLPIIYNLKGTWQVGLSEISYTKSWENLPHDQPIELLYYNNGIQTIKGAIIKAGHYTTNELIDSINIAIGTYLSIFHSARGSQSFLESNNWELVDIPTVSLDKSKTRVKLSPGSFLNKQLIFIKPGPLICELLGYKIEEIELDVKEAFSKYNNNQQETWETPLHYPFKEFNINNAIKCLYVYSGICEERVVGETFKPLLRVVEVPNNAKFGDQITIQYDSPQYSKVKKNYFTDIDITLKQQSNYLKQQEILEPNIHFNFGQTIVTLHFKKIADSEVTDSFIPTEDIDDHTLEVENSKPEPHPLERLKDM